MARLSKVFTDRETSAITNRASAIEFPVNKVGSAHLRSPRGPSKPGLGPFRAQWQKLPLVSPPNRLSWLGQHWSTRFVHPLPRRKIHLLSPLDLFSSGRPDVCKTDDHIQMQGRLMKEIIQFPMYSHSIYGLDFLHKARPI